VDCAITELDLSHNPLWSEQERGGMRPSLRHGVSRDFNPGDDGPPGVSILCGPFWLRFTHATPVLVTKH
jgi:hypothetical protein